MGKYIVSLSEVRRLLGTLTWGEDIPQPDGLVSHLSRWYRYCRHTYSGHPVIIVRPGSEGLWVVSYGYRDVTPKEEQP